MHVEEELKLKFDPQQVDNPKIREIFSDPIARVLWIAIKSRHLASQYFNDSVLKSAAAFNTLEGELKYDYDSFLKCMSPLIPKFGTVTVYEGGIYGSNCHRKPDHEFWGDIFKVIHGQRCFDIKIEIPEQTSTSAKGI